MDELYVVAKHELNFLMESVQETEVHREEEQEEDHSTQKIDVMIVGSEVTTPGTVQDNGVQEDAGLHPDQDQDLVQDQGSVLSVLTQGLHPAVDPEAEMEESLTVNQNHVPRVDPLVDQNLAHLIKKIDCT